jgi:hypothetical protein
MRMFRHEGMPGLYGAERSVMPDATASRVRVDVSAPSTRPGPGMLVQHRTQARAHGSARASSSARPYGELADLADFAVSEVCGVRCGKRVSLIFALRVPVRVVLVAVPKPSADRLRTDVPPRPIERLGICVHIGHASKASASEIGESAFSRSDPPARTSAGGRGRSGSHSGMLFQ